MQAPPIQSPRRLTVAEVRILSLASIGGALEFYDFVIFVFFTSVIGKLFFAANVPDLSLIHIYRVTIHNLRNCDYRTETSYTNCWADRTVYLSQLKGADFFFTNWGPRWIGHPIVSFDFGDSNHIAFSIEARYKTGQSYSAILGFFRQYELIFLTADERDVIRLRTNYRKAEEVYMYRTTVSSGAARRIFLSYVDYLNQLRGQPEWYLSLIHI